MEGEGGVKTALDVAYEAHVDTAHAAGLVENAREHIEFGELIAAKTALVAALDSADLAPSAIRRAIRAVELELERKANP